MKISDYEISDLNNLPGEEIDASKNNNFSRYYLFATIFIFISFIIFSFYLSYFKFNKYSELSLQNRVIKIPVIATRGVIFDRNMNQLSFNVPSFDLYINISNLSNEEIKTDEYFLSSILNIPVKKIKKNIQNQIKLGYQSILIANSISKENDILITSNKSTKGLYIKQSYYIKYRYNNLLSHIIGYTGPVTEQELLANKNLNPEDIIGRYGIEQSFNNYLMGKDGVDITQVNTLGNRVSNFGEISPVPGDNVQLTINSNIQKELQSLIIQNIKINPNHVTGAVGIVENVNTGGILAMVSYPTFNNNNFEAGGISSANYSKLINNPEDPLLNRAITEEQPVGSIMKTILLLAGLQVKAITPTTQFSVPGTFVYDGTTFQNYAKINWGVADIVKCLQFSINVFAFKSALKIGINNFVKFEKDFGLGAKTNIQLPGELSGIISDPKNKYLITKQPWNPGDLLNASIGQGYTEVTPIQVVNWISAIANGGKLMQPRIVKAIYSSNNKLVKSFGPKIIRQGFVSQANLSVIKTGMLQAVQNGIDIAAKSTLADNAGKSGTAQFGVESVGNQNNRYTQAHSWMSSFAPYNKPQIAMVVFEENGGLSTYSAEVVKNFMNWYFKTY